MAISTVRAQVNGSWHTLTLNPKNGKYEATISAPGSTSFVKPGGYYDVRVEATNTAGTMGFADASTLEGLKLYVRERIKPTITIVSPNNGAYVSNNKQPVVFTVTDETGGSGIKISTLVVKQDNTPVSTYSTSAITNGYSVTYTPDKVLIDGKHTVTVDVSDNDGNAASQKSVSYTIDTIPPALNVSSPSEGLVTAKPSLTVNGTTNDSSASPVTVTISLNGTDQGSVSVSGEGAFSKTVTLREGINTITVKARDAAGKESVVTRTVTLDTSVPKVVSASIVPNPVDAGKTMVISVEISG